MSDDDVDDKQPGGGTGMAPPPSKKRATRNDDSDNDDEQVRAQIHRSRSIFVDRYSQGLYAGGDADFSRRVKAFEDDDNDGPEKSSREVFAARNRRVDARIGDTSDAKVVSGLRAAKVRKITNKDGEETVIDQVEGEEADQREEESYVVDGEAVDIEPFNLEAERREGHFDQDGHYIEKGFNADGTRKKGADDDDDDDENAASADPWLGEVDEWNKVSECCHRCASDMRWATLQANGKDAFQKVELAHRVQVSRVALENEAKPIDVDRCVAVVESLVHDNESVREAMNRLRPERKPRRPAKHKRDNDTDAATSAAAATATAAATDTAAEQTFAKLVDATNDLVALGFADVYSATVARWTQRVACVNAIVTVLSSCSTRAWRATRAASTTAGTSAIPLDFDDGCAMSCARDRST
jgi:hypothetical protein